MQSVKNLQNIQKLGHQKDIAKMQKIYWEDIHTQIRGQSPKILFIMNRNDKNKSKLL